MKSYTKPFSPALKLSKSFKRMLATMPNRKLYGHVKGMFLDAEQSLLNKTYIKPERTKDE